MRKSFVFLFLSLSGILVLPVLSSELGSRPRSVLNAAPSGTTDYPWTMFHYDQFRDGVSSASGPTFATLMWSYKTGNSVYPSPIVADGYVFIPSYDGTLYAFDEYTGALLWSFSTGGNVYASPAVANGIVYVASQNGFVYALNEQSGAIVWQIANDNLTPVISSPVVADGMVFYGTFESASSGFSELLGVDATTGTVLWRDDLSSTFVSGGAAVENGVLIIGTGFPGSAVVRAFNETTGASLWSYNTRITTTISTTPALANGRVYVGLDSSALVALNQTTGGLIWSFSTTGGSNATSPAINSGVVYFGTGSRTVYALNAVTGATIWARTTGGAVTSSPAIALGSNALFVGSNDHYLYALNLANGAVLWRYLTGGQVSSSPAVADGRVFFGCKDQKVYALGPALPKLYDTMTVNPAILLSGQNSTLTISVRNSTNPQSNANITITSSLSAVISQPILISPGTFQATFTAPMVSSTTLITVQMTASMKGYASATNQTSITVNPYSTSMVAGPTTLEPSQNSTLTIMIRNGTSPLSNADLTFTSSAGGVFSKPVLVGPGMYQTVFTAPTVSSTTIVSIQFTASVNGIPIAMNQTSVTENPFPILTVAVSPKPGSISPGGEITLMIRVTNGTLLVPGASLLLSSNAGGNFFSITDSGNGNYTSIFSTPLQASDPVVTVRASKNDFTTGQGQTTVVVNGVPNLTTLKVSGIPFFYLVAAGVVLFLLVLGVLVSRKRRSKPLYPAASDAFNY